MTGQNGGSASDPGADLRWPPARRVRLFGFRNGFDLEFCPTAAAVTLIVVFVGGAAGFAWFAFRGIAAFDMALLAATMFVTGLGISLGYHRLFAHKSFVALPALRIGLGILGAMTMQGTIALWVSTHRRHHRYADQPGDPHSPVRGTAPRGRAGPVRLFLHAHVGWLLSRNYAVYPGYIRDLCRDRCVRFVDRWYAAWGVAGWLAPGLAGAVWYGDTAGFWSGFFAGGPLRTLVQLNLTWLVNSLGHAAGKRHFATHDESRNNAVLNMLTMNGEGLHNNHHAFPWSARLAHTRGEIDPSYWVLCLLARVGLVSNVRVPAPAQLAALALPAPGPLGTPQRTDAVRAAVDRLPH